MNRNLLKVGNKQVFNKVSSDDLQKNEKTQSNTY